MNIIWKKILKSLLLIFSLIIILTLIINLLYYFDIIDNTIIKYFKMIMAIISFFAGGFYLGMNSPNKGYLYGLKLSLIVIIILIICGIIFNSLKTSMIIYYLIVTFVITFAAMLGINKKS